MAHPATRNSQTAVPAFWFLGMAIEAAVVPTLAFNPRFQKVVQAQSLQTDQMDAAQKRLALVKVLEPGARQRLSSLIDKCNRILELYRS